METVKVKFKTVEEYLSSLPQPANKILSEVRKTIKKAAPKAEELISYNIPALKQNGMLIFFAGWKDHISLYPRTAGMEKAFGDELQPYASAKGTLKFSLKDPIPYELIARLVAFRVQENENTAIAKKKKKKNA